MIVSLDCNVIDIPQQQGWLKGGVFLKPPPRIENS